MRQCLAQFLHVRLRNGCGSCLDEIDIVSQHRELSAAELQQHAYAGGYKKGCCLWRRAQGGEETYLVFHSVGYDKCAACNDHRPHLAQAADVIVACVGELNNMSGEGASRR